MAKLNEVWKWLSLWVMKKIRSPFSNFATKFTMIVGSTIVATPLIEQLLFNALLKRWLNVDLKIDIPDLNAYFFGSFLITLSLIHNLIYIKLTNHYQIKIKDIEGSVYKQLWNHLDSVIDNTARLIQLYTKIYDSKFDDYALKAEESIIEAQAFLRKNRPFFFSEEFYRKCSDVNDTSYRVTQYYRVCLQAQKYDENLLPPEKINDINIERVLKEFNFIEAQKDVRMIFEPAHSAYNEICLIIRQHVNSL